ncbi:MAG: 50S ribosomal protein L4 [Candidatus Ryanbacteria bacterium RIFCSPHIGHO2_01_FULL_48_27]|jgi:large subunit ribosomal protein L4|uniref:Large ribosomal subunit protein uL4 n=1 Tax=Candidatus Ryanbacteria bacterium RIFCSPHIGHO2_01_FULL_48_27 TaxID=1802115 RepID=A0A1G2G418_9BACT|nr:MAG: 50S ribosomal protein L4 [Candidatus Ryanbacteria bacterium RIFCSPHIGHO2_01_FULL_48_27]
MISVKVYNLQGEEAGSEQLPEALFGMPWNNSLVKQVVDAKLANSRNVIAHAKGRGEVSGGGKKPWRQKGTGRARHGSIRSPIWVGGGVTHGPNKEKNYSQKINKQMQRKALLISLSRKAKDGEIMILDTVRMQEPKTKLAAKAFTALSHVPAFPKLGQKGGRVLLMIPGKDDVVVRATRNLPYVTPQEARNMDLLSVLEHKYIIIPKEALAVIQKTFVK